MNGVISRVFLTRGFGFIEGEDGNSYFMHVDNLSSHTVWEQMRIDLHVIFDPCGNGKKGNGLRANNVVVKE